jgi:TetR/AcrR family transcriptional repressor of bet genes
MPADHSILIVLSINIAESAVLADVLARAFHVVSHLRGIASRTEDTFEPMATLAKSKTRAKEPRKATRQIRKKQLIEATIAMLAQKGQTGLKLQDIAEAAGLSYGLVNFHFETKEKLLAETLRYMAAEYQGNWRQALANAGQSPAHQLCALIEADFNEMIYTPSRLMAWCTFWGEAQSRPYYFQECSDFDLEYIRVMEGICSRLLSEQGIAMKPERVARVIRVTVEGVWLDQLTMAKPYSRKEGLRTVYTCLAAFFPKVFDENGPCRP